MHVAPLQPDDLALLQPVFARAFGELCHTVAAPLAEGLLEWCWTQRVAASADSQGWALWAGEAVEGFISAHLDADGNATVTAPALAMLDASRLALLLEAARNWLRAHGKWRAEFSGLHRCWQTPFGGELFLHLLNQGCWCYPEGPLGVVMELDVARYAATPAVAAIRTRLEGEGLCFEWLAPPWVERASALMWAGFQRRGLAQPLSDGSGRLPYVICHDGEQAVGFCGPMRLDPFGFGDWSFPFVIEAQRGRGIGAALLAQATTWLHNAGARQQVILTDTSNRAQRSYRQAGFRYCYVAAHDLFLGV